MFAWVCQKILQCVCCVAHLIATKSPPSSPSTTICRHAQIYTQWGSEVFHMVFTEKTNPLPAAALRRQNRKAKQPASTRKGRWKSLLWVWMRGAVRDSVAFLTTPSQPASQPATVIIDEPASRDSVVEPSVSHNVLLAYRLLWPAVRTFIKRRALNSERDDERFLAAATVFRECFVVREVKRVFVCECVVARWWCCIRDCGNYVKLNGLDQIDSMPWRTWFAWLACWLWFVLRWTAAAAAAWDNSDINSRVWSFWCCIVDWSAHYTDSCCVHR